jgi:hypothetical protein
MSSEEMQPDDDEVDEADPLSEPLTRKIEDGAKQTGQNRRQTSPGHDWLSPYDCPPEAASAGKYLEHLYASVKRVIASIIKRYAHLSDITSVEDLWSEAYVAFDDAWKKYDPDRGTFEMYMRWYVQKRYQKLVGNDRVVEIWSPEGEYVETKPYSTFMKRKKVLKKQGMTWTVKSRVTRYIDDYVDRIDDEEPGEIGS